MSKWAGWVRSPTKRGGSLLPWGMDCVEKKNQLSFSSCDFLLHNFSFLLDGGIIQKFFGAKKLHVSWMNVANITESLGPNPSTVLFNKAHLCWLSENGGIVKWNRYLYTLLIMCMDMI